ncbi:hypothetical protein MJG53_001132 [Ovis ammon polii x Ovis aries]|uniref:Uncharacterized protein n=1 Tax=Ovis ammon polii x Ovis aries TaxID=2918886 RepID=A0ACB9VK10_9CETA|nr:hypothetical protein MJT46_000629 [Ovis ammon polii x Ovis aries]KAI4590083.1 hypothetical protein MJG53_001132 [Ovis ammon polii x Ovis aries]
MASQAKGLLSEECRDAINRIASYELHVSDAYLSMRPDLDNWGTGKQALLSAVQLENELNELLQDLKASASRNRETNLLRFTKKFLDEQTRNLSYLEYQLNYQMDLEKSTQSEGQPENVAGPSGTAGQETESAGNSPSPPAQKVPKSAP